MTAINVDICHKRGFLFFEIDNEVFICLFFVYLTIFCQPYILCIAK
jgi:hypothetical protein